MASEAYNSYVRKHTCSDCGKIVEHVIYDWVQRLPWCVNCWKDLLNDQRASSEEEY